MKECIALGVTRVWMHRAFGGGSVDPAAAELGRAHGVTVIDGGCPCMFAPTADGGHRFIRAVCTLTGAVPRTGRRGGAASRPDDVLERPPGRVAGGGVARDRGRPADPEHHLWAQQAREHVVLEQPPRRRPPRRPARPGSSPGRPASRPARARSWSGPRATRPGASSSTVQTATSTSGCSARARPGRWRGARSGSAAGAPRGGRTGRRCRTGTPSALLRSTHASCSAAATGSASWAWRAASISSSARAVTAGSVRTTTSAPQADASSASWWTRPGGTGQAPAPRRSVLRFSRAASRSTPSSEISPSPSRTTASRSGSAARGRRLHRRGETERARRGDEVVQRGATAQDQVAAGRVDARAAAGRGRRTARRSRRRAAGSTRAGCC